MKTKEIEKGAVTETPKTERTPEPLPEKVVALHKAVGPDGLSNDKAWGDQGWFNLMNVKKRLVKAGLTGKKLAAAMEKLYSSLFGYETEENGEVSLVPCFFRPALHTLGMGPNQKTWPREIAPRWMAWVNDAGEIIYTYIDPTTGKRMETSDSKKEGAEAKRTGCFFTTMKDAVKEGGKVVDFNVGVRAICPLHRDRVKQLLRLPTVVYDDAKARLESIVANKTVHLERREMFEEDLDAAFGKEFVQRQLKRQWSGKGGDQMRQGFRRGQKRQKNSKRQLQEQEA